VVSGRAWGAEHGDGVMGRAQMAGGGEEGGVLQDGEHLAAPQFALDLRPGDPGAWQLHVRAPGGERIDPAVDAPTVPAGQKGGVGALVEGLNRDSHQAARPSQAVCPEGFNGHHPRPRHGDFPRNQTGPEWMAVATSVTVLTVPEAAFADIFGRTAPRSVHEEDRHCRR
jgi:hypothetical protein